MVTGSCLGSATCSPPAMGCAHTAQTSPTFNGVFVWSQKTCSKANVGSSSPCSQRSCPRGWSCSSLFPALFLPLFPTGCSLHGPCRCPELAQPLQASGSRFINEMPSFQPSPGRAGSTGSAVHMWGGHTWIPLQP